jgi:hypothetical protein
LHVRSGSDLILTPQAIRKERKPVMTADREQRVLELVIFKLKDGATRDELLATVGGVTGWAKAQPGFVSRDLRYSESEDQWIDVLWWDSLEAAEVAADAALSSDSCAPMFELIDMDSTVMLHGEPAEAGGLAA